MTEFLSGSQKCCGVREFTMLVRLQHVSESLQQNREDTVKKTVLHMPSILSDHQKFMSALGIRTQNLTAAVAWESGKLQRSQSDRDM
jgi:hypothetical protein